jgi:opacity protein-like surface antigen
MFKKIFAITVLAIASSVAFASPAPYVGAGLGVTVNTSKSFGNYRGVPFNVFAGYGGVVNQSLYLAGELDATVGTAEISNHSTGLKTSYGYGASVLPGAMLSDHTLAFARLGVVRSRFSNPSTTVTGAKFGLGLQTTVTQNIDVRGEYDYTSYRSINRNGLSNSPASDAANLALVYKFD